MEIRKLQHKDIPAVEEIFDMYWSGRFRLNLSERLISPSMSWIVVVEGVEIVGVAASRPAPERMQKYAKTKKVIEFYVSVAKYKNRGIGTALRNERIKEAREQEYEEAVFYSGYTHKDSWNFHDSSEFMRVGEEIAPDGELGMIWLMNL